GNMEIGGYVKLPPPSESTLMIIGANSKLSTADEDVTHKVNSLEPYGSIYTRDGQLSFALCLAYDIIINEQNESGDDTLDNMFSLEGGVMFSANEEINVGAQYIVSAAQNTLVEFIPEIKINVEPFQWGVAVSIPLKDDNPQVTELDKKIEVIFDMAVTF
ncbi:hypothetical protein ACFL2A_00905, partial [Thermodesulfobacteriota bacterium]